MANTFKFGNEKWAVGKETVLAYNDENNNFKPLPFTFDRGSIATVVNSDGLIETVGVDEPRIDFLNNTKGHLLLEPQRSNYLKNNEDLQGDGWSNVGGLTLEFNQDDPFGGSNAVKMTDFNDNGDRYDANTSKVGVNGETVTYSGYYKGSGTIRIGLNTGTGIGGSTEIDINLTDEWVRHEITVTFTSAVTGNYRAHTAITRTNNNDAVVYLSYPQIEVGSYATSIIKTEGSAVTRSAETCNNAGNSTVFNDSEGVLYWECSSLYDDLTNRIISVSEGNQNNTVQLYFDASSNRIRGTVRSVDGTYQCILNYTASDTTDYIKAAIKYKDNDFSLWVNGVERATDTSGNAPTGLSEISFDSGSGSLDFYGNVKDLRVYNTALSDSELETLTTL